jgi:molecular chaperone DnaJ
VAEKRDFYDVLGAAKGASEDEIKKAYRQKAKQYHPDLHPDDAEAEARMKEVNEAYEVLSDPQKKGRYDQFGHAGVDPNAGAGGGFQGNFDFGDLGDLFGNIFGGFGGGGRTTTASPNAPRRGPDLEEHTIIAFEEAAHGCRRTLEVNRVEACDDCGGSGAARGTSPRICPECGGSGQKTVQQRTPFGVISTSKPCPQCQGRGKSIDSPCPKCRGGGRVRKRVPIECSIPAGIDDGQVLRVRGEGNKGVNGGTPGDLLIGVTVRPHPIFERDGYNLLCDIGVQFWQAALGDTIQVPTLDGKIEQRIAPGTQPGTVITLRGRGVPVIDGGGRKGDAFLRIQVEVPEALSAEQRNQLEQLRGQFPASSAASPPKAPPLPPEEKHGFFRGRKK